MTSREKYIEILKTTHIVFYGGKDLEFMFV